MAVEYGEAVGTVGSLCRGAPGSMRVFEPSVSLVCKVVEAELRCP
jgi:hypothetical protein